MVNSSIKSNRVKSLPFGIAIGTSIALIISILLSALLTGLVLKGSLQEEVTGISLFFVRVVAVMAGGLVSASFAHGKILPVIGLMIAAYLLVLLGTSIIAFDGKLDGFGIGVLSALIGGAIACIIKLKPQRKRKTMSRIAR